MKKLITLAFLLSLTVPCFADSSHDTIGGSTLIQNTNINSSDSYAESNSHAQASSNSTALSNSNATGGNANALAMGGTAISNSQGGDGGNANATGGSSNSNSGGNTLSGTNTNGGNSVNIDTPRQAPAAIAPSVAASGNNGVSVGVSTIFGGFSGGISKVDKSTKELNQATANLNNSQSIVLLSTCNTDVCRQAERIILRKMSK